MIHIHTLGFPRIGANRELKLALESYWLGKTSRLALEATGAELRQRHWQDQSMLDLVPVGDFSYYDHVLDMSFTLGNLPERIRGVPGTVLDNSFRIARGCSAQHADIESRCKGITAGEMTKWFDTNYHYIVPEFSSSSQFRLDASRLLDQLAEANSLGVKAKPVIIGPVTYLALGKARDGSDRLELLARLLPVYTELLATFSSHGVEWVQIDEPLLVTELTPEWQKAFQIAYKQLSGCEIKLLLTTYFGPLAENLEMVASLPVEGLHIDVSHDHDDVERLIQALPKQVILSLGVINGRNVWKSDLHAMLDWLEPLAARMCERLWLAPSCSLLHVPVDLDREQALNGEIKSWLAFAKQKIGELVLLASALHSGRDTVRTELTANQAATSARRESPRTNSPAVKTAMAGITPSMSRRQSPYAERAAKQAPLLKLPVLPTTTIGSFPQTDDIRRARKLYKAGRLDQTAYRDAMRAEIARCVREQEKLDLDVLVHGEAERNDMVEFFGAQLDGYAISQFGWVQSYGSRCVKPPLLYGDVRRSQPMSVEWIAYAQSLTNKPVKGILTGPVTMLNWSFVRDDQPRSLSCKQLALAIREEVLDLEKAGVRVIQIDEAALREGLPLRQSQWPDYLHWAVETYRLAANGVADQTQIHTHMCYAEFNDIIAAIAAMDADVITIETSRSNMELLDTFDVFKYPNGIGPGVYDIHSPNIPRKEHIVELILKATERIPAERLWVNPDCGLKTRQWREVIPALTNMVAAAHTLRNKLTSSIRHVPY